MYNQKLRSKILREGNVLPEAGHSTALFTDGTRFPICRPSGPDFVQREFYYGKDSMHCLGFQVTTAPDGMIVDLFGGFPGSRHDAHILVSSQLNRRLHDIQVGRPTQYKSYMDKGYYNDSHLIAAYKIYDDTPQWQRDSNRIMSPMRIGVEWGINKLKCMSPLLSNLYVMKIQQSQVSKYVFAGALISNMHTCLHGSESSKYFDCSPPTLEEYMM